MDEFGGAAALLARHALGRPSFAPVFEPLGDARASTAGTSIAGKGSSTDDATTPRATVAVDGSHAVLADNGSVWVTAHRAAAVAWPGPRPVEPVPVIKVTLAEEAQAAIDAAYAAANAPPPRALGADAFGGALCALAEFGAARAAIRAAAAGTLFLWDGALRGLPPHAQALASNLQAEATACGVRLVAVAKRSALTVGVPLAPWLQEHGPAGTWLARVPGQDGVFVARLHARSRHAFRVDADDPADVAALVPLSRDAVYVGYPYPLARVHNLVALTGGRVAELKARLDGELRKSGPAAVRLAGDFHAVLDRSVPG